jgi:hypothetical protein
VDGESNHLLVHLSPDKAAVYRGSPAILWSEQLQCWITADPATMVAIQKDAAFAVLDQSAELEKIRRRLHIDLPGIDRVFRNVPVNVEGSEHTERRRRMARTIAARTEDALARFTALAERLCAENLARSGESELIAEVFEPLTIVLARALSGIALTHNRDFLSPTQVFDKSLGLNRRKLIDKQISALWREACRSMSEDEADGAIALAVLGSDTILASLALTFVERVSAHPGVPLSGIAWGDRISATAVPFIERVATRATEVAGATIREGDLVRLFLDGFALEPPEKRDGFFGAGRLPWQTDSPAGMVCAGWRPRPVAVDGARREREVSRRRWHVCVSVRGQGDHRWIVTKRSSCWRSYAHRWARRRTPMAPTRISPRRRSAT